MSDELRKVGALWRPKPGAKSKGSGELTINGQRQRFVVLENRYKDPGSNQPDYVLMSSDPPEPDPFAENRPDPEEERRPITDEDFPF